MPRLLLLLIVTLAAAALLAEATPSRPARAAPRGTNGKIAFVSGTNVRVGIYIVNADGSGRTWLADGGYRALSWSPDGSKIAFDVFSRDTQSSEIHVTALDGSGPVNLSDGSFQAYPTWSPAGGRIAYEGELGIYTMNSDGSNKTNIADGAAPVWSPDGSRVAFVKRSSSSPAISGGTLPILDVYVVNTDGTGEQNVSNSLGPYRDLSWTPDGSSILALGRDSNFYLMPADGRGQATLLTRDQGTAGVTPSWSPDGSKILFSTNRTTSGIADILVMNGDGANPVDLTNIAEAQDEQPSWSPDGQQIAFWSTSAPSVSEIRVMNADGTNQRQVTEGGWPLAWQPLYRMGDPNCDTTSNSVDAALILQYAAGLVPTMPCLRGGHANQDGRINAVDASVILQYSARLITTIPP